MKQWTGNMAGMALQHIFGNHQRTMLKLAFDLLKPDLVAFYLLRRMMNGMVQSYNMKLKNKFMFWKFGKEETQRETETRILREKMYLKELEIRCSKLPL